MTSLKVLNQPIEEGEERRNTFVEHISTEAFAPTLLRVERAIEHARLTIFARIDHAAAARSVGMVMPATTVLVYGKPHGGTPIMLAVPRAALDLPLRVLVREDDEGHARISFHPIVDVLREAGVADHLAMRLALSQEILVDVVRS